MSIGTDREEGTGTIIVDKVRLPKRFNVLLYNDDYTTMEFVIEVLQTVFRKNKNEAMSIMLQVHGEGKGKCGVYTYEIAEIKVAKVLQMSRGQGHPLKCTMEEE